MKSAIVAILVALALVAAFAIVARHDWPAHDPPLDPAWWWGAFGAGMYASVTAGLVVRRIGQPKLRRPLLLYVIAFPLFVIGLVAETQREPRDPSDPDYGNESSVIPDESPFTSPMGRGNAIFWLIILLVLDFLAGAVLVTRSHP